MKTKKTIKLTESEKQAQRDFTDWFLSEFVGKNNMVGHISGNFDPLTMTGIKVTEDKFKSK